MACFDVLKEDYLRFPEEDSSKVWQPDLFFPEAKEVDPGSGTYINEEYFRVRYDGSVMWVRRLAMTNLCTFDFSQLPFDTQNCSLSIECFGESIKTTYVMWDVPSVMGFDKIQGNEWNSFAVTEYEGIKEYSTGTFSYAGFTFSMTREAHSYLQSALQPATAFVLISYSGYWIDAKAAPARIALAVISVLISVSSLSS
eukprot:gene25298-30883_t